MWSLQKDVFEFGKKTIHNNITWDILFIDPLLISY